MFTSKTPFVSVVVPCYKQGKFLRDSVGSILSQTYPHWEVIIVDDGSPDDTSQIAQAIINENPSKKIRLLRKANGGLSDARNTGIAASEGGWVLPLDADDRFEPEFLEKAFNLIESVPTCNLVFSNLQQFGAKTDTWIPSEYTLIKLSTEMTFPYSSMYKKELWVRTGGYERGLPWAGEDRCFWIACSKLGIRSLRIHDFLFLYRIHEGGSMYTKLVEHWEEVEGMIRTMHPEIYNSFELISMHEVISEMKQDTFDQLTEKIKRFPDLAFPHLWRGLKLEHDGKREEAIASYADFTRLHFRADWQGLWRELSCRLSIGDKFGARICADELREKFPELTWVKDVCDHAFREHVV